LAGKRPFGVSILYMGWDKHYGYQLYQSDPSGNYSGWKATCIGNNSAVSILFLNKLHFRNFKIYTGCSLYPETGIQGGSHHPQGCKEFGHQSTWQNFGHDQIECREM